MSGCYWCGEPTKSSEHVPPKSIFPKDRRINLITVPSCPEHNEAFRLLDERMRFYIQVSCVTPFAFDEFDKVTMRSLEDEKAKGFTASLFKGNFPVKLSEGETRGLRINPEYYKLYFEKITRGLHYNHTKTQFEGEATSGWRQSFVHHKAMEEYFRRLAPHFNNPALVVQPKVHNPEIFRYRFIDREQDGNRIFAVAMQFYQDFEAITILTNTPIVMT